MTADDRTRLAIDDLRSGLRLWPLAWKLAWLDIKLRYRGSMLGPFWLTVSTGVMVGALGVLYAALFHMSLREYLPFLALSQVLWNFLATLVSESCQAFTEAEGVIRSTRMPYFLFALRLLARNLLVLGHNIVVVVVTFALLAVWPDTRSLLVLPALLLWCVDALAVTMVLGGFCARFRDILPIVNSVMQIGFFITPIIWKPEQLGWAAVWLPVSPFFDMLEVVRAPLLGEIPGILVWAGALGWSIALWVIAWFFFRRVRGRIAFWI